jgi:hypothetical protein
LKFECFEHAKTFLVISSFDHVNFENNRKYFKNIYDNPNYYAFFVIFHTYKNEVLKKVIHLGGSFDFVFTLKPCPFHT